MIVACLAGLAMITSMPHNGWGATLRQVIAASHVPLAGAPTTTLNRRIVGYSTACRGKDFLIGYRVDQSKGDFATRLFFARYDSSRRSWVQHSFRDGKPPLGWIFGMVGSVRFVGPNEFAELEYSPSAIRTLELNSNLGFLHDFYGWQIAGLNTGIIVYEESMIQFAATHSARISVFDSESGKSHVIFPVDPALPIQAKWYRDLRASYGKCRQTWFRDHMYPLDASSGDRDVLAAAANAASDSVAVAIEYSDYGFNCNVPKPAPVAATYVYLHASDPSRLVRREFPIASGHDVSDAELAALLTVASLRKLFGDDKSPETRN